MDEYDEGDWHVKKYANGWVQMEGTPGVDYGATKYSSSTGFHFRNGTVSIPVKIDRAKPCAVVGNDCSPGLQVLNFTFASDNSIYITAGQNVQGIAISEYKTSIKVCGYSL